MNKRFAYLCAQCCFALCLGMALVLTDVHPVTAQSADPNAPQDQADVIGIELMKLREITRGVDEANQTAEATRALADGNCQIGMALAAIATGENGQLVEVMKSASSSYGTAMMALEQLVKNKRFYRAIGRRNVSWLIETGLFTSPPQMQDDILIQILILTQNAKDAADRIAAGQGKDADLSILVETSAKIPRLLMAFFRVVTA